MRFFLNERGEKIKESPHTDFYNYFFKINLPFKYEKSQI